MGITEIIKDALGAIQSLPVNAVLRERLAFAADEAAKLERENESLKASNEKLSAEFAHLQKLVAKGRSKFLMQERVLLAISESSVPTDQTVTETLVMSVTAARTAIAMACAAGWITETLEITDAGFQHLNVMTQMGD